MYTGLVLLPWVMLFGFSGMLFNHPEWFGPVEVISEFRSRDLTETHGFVLLDADEIADELVERLNADPGIGRFERPRASVAVIEGTLGYEAKTPSGSAAVFLSPNGNGANVRRMVPSRPEDRPSFHGTKIELDHYDPARSESVARKLLEEARVEGITSIEPSRRGGAELRFQVESSEDHRLWNVVYGLESREITARATDTSGGANPYQVLTRLHKTHHYPDRKGSRWFWTLFADLTGITMVFWGLSGVAMWWQIKPSRLMGVAGLGVAAVLAGLVFSGTIANLTFGPTQQRGGGVPSPRREDSAAPRDSDLPRGETPREPLSESREDSLSGPGSRNSGQPTPPSP